MAKRKDPELLKEELEKAAFTSVDEQALKEDMDKRNPDDEEIEVVISNLENPGVEIAIGCGPTNNRYERVFTHGFKYVIPRKIARFIESLKVPEYQYIPDGTGKQRKMLVGYRNRFSCKQVF